MEPNEKSEKSVKPAPILRQGVGPKTDNIEAFRAEADPPINHSEAPENPK
ncbi:hypothetical protein [Rhizobium ruizarguesonis]